MNRTVSVVLGLLLATAGSAAGQAMAPARPDAVDQLVVSLGALGTGRVTQGATSGHIGLFSSDLPRMLVTSPQAERYAHIFARDSRVGRPLLLAGAALLAGGLTAYVTRHGHLGMGGRETAAFGAGAVAFMYGADLLDTSRQALRSAVDEYNRTAAEH